MLLAEFDKIWSWYRYFRT